MIGKNEIDVICPIYHVDLESFKIFIDTWYRNIPIRKLYIGLGKENDELVEFIIKYCSSNNLTFEIYEQYWYKTLGYCLQQLINEVETEYFIYLHSDVEILLNWYPRMWEARVRGILESLKDPSFGAEALVQARKQRAYSGAQLIYKKCLEFISWEDDYVYCNEDIIIKNHIINHGYTYVKTPIYHKHYRMLSKRSQPRDIILEWQFKGILKYSEPSYILMNYIKGILITLKKEYKKPFILNEWIEKLNPKWFDFLN
jgi:hypothetical protein